MEVQNWGTYFVENVCVCDWFECVMTLTTKITQDVQLHTISGRSWHKPLRLKTIEMMHYCTVQLAIDLTVSFFVVDAFDFRNESC